jgi:hypothetical protein
MNKCIDELTLNFLKKFVLGQKTDINNPDEVIKKCISLAYKDMMTAGLYYLDSNLDKGVNQKTKNNNDRKAKFLDILQDKSFMFSRDLIADTCSIFGDEDKIKNTQGYATRYGLAQKLVNMTFKYLYVFKDEIKQDINFSNCDCPLDSIIISNLSPNYVWSKLTPAEYDDLQNEIDAKVESQSEYKNLGRLLYDFQNW